MLRVTRADKSERSFWRARPDDTAIDDASLEVVLPEGALLTDLDPAVLAPQGLPDLWTTGEVPWPALADYFSGKHLVTQDMGGWTESLLIPAAEEAALKTAVAAAVKKGLVWFVSGIASLLGEDVPEGFIDERALLLPPPAAMGATQILPSAIPAARTADEATADHLRVVLSAQSGWALPWATLRMALDQGFQLGLFERTLDSGPWPCDLGGAAALKLRLVKGVKEPTHPATPGTAKSATAVLETHQIVDLADLVPDLRAATAGHNLTLMLTVAPDRGGAVE